jgi:hypothetical protein
MYPNPRLRLGMMNGVGMRTRMLVSISSSDALDDVADVAGEPCGVTNSRRNWDSLSGRSP